MHERRIIWPSWICLALGFVAVFPYAMLFAVQVHLLPRASAAAGFFSGSVIFWEGLLFGVPGVLTGWLLLAGDKDRPKGLVIPCAAGIVLGVLGILANLLMLSILFTAL